MVICYLALGSNLGPRRRTIRKAVQLISALPGTRVLKRSRLIETEAVGGPAGGPRFFNACIKIETSLPVYSLLGCLQRIEKELGRTRTKRWGARTIDVDILLYGDRIIDTRRLKLPHPRMFGRQFVLRPLREVL